MLIGGKLYKHSMVAVGAVAAAAIATIRPDIFFLGATGVHPRHGFSTGDFEEAAIKRQIAAQSANTYVALTAEKLDRASAVSIMPLEAATGAIVGADVYEEALDMLESAGLEIIRA
jgi:DeoR/GlpR family transcriptional regulator of sugar metabolism